MDDDLVIELDDETLTVLKWMAEAAGLPVEEFVKQALRRDLFGGFVEPPEDPSP